MAALSPKFTVKQLEFLSVMAAFDTPVSLDVVGQLARISHGEVYDLLRKCESKGWIMQHKDNTFGLSTYLPEYMLSKIEKINSCDKLVELAGVIIANNMRGKIPPRAFNNVIKKSKKRETDIKWEITKAIESLQKYDTSEAKNHAQQIDILLPTLDVTSPDTNWFILESIKLSELAVTRGSSILPTTTEMLLKTVAISERVGDERSWAMAYLLLGRAYWLLNKLNKAVSCLERGKKKVEDLGDSDISIYAAWFIGLYYCILGNVNEAATYLKTIMQYFWESEEYIMAYDTPLLLAYCDSNRNDFHRAIGTLDFYRQLAVKREDNYNASLYQAHLGINLCMIRKREEALFHLEASQKDALSVNNMLAYWGSLMGLSCLYFNEGDYDRGIPLFEKMLKFTEDAGYVHQIFIPWFLESYFYAEQAGVELPAEWRFDAIFEKIMAEPSIDLQGVALRLRAVKSIALRKDDEMILRDLKGSWDLLSKCGDLFQLSKTKIEMVRFYLRLGQYETARCLAYNVYKDLTGYCETFFPDDLGFLLGGTKMSSGPLMDQYAPLKPTLRMLEDLFSEPGAMKMDLFLSTLSWYLRAERSGLFMFEDTTGTTPELRVARNLSRSIIGDQKFRLSLDMIITCHREKKLILSDGVKQSDAESSYKCSMSMLCIPLFNETNVSAVLYFDNSYLPSCFSSIEVPILESLGRHLSGIIEKQQLENLKLAAQPKHSIRDIGDVLPASSEFASVNIVAKDQKMITLLKRAKRLAESEAPILILGETGSGKEVVAQWIHRNSSRSEKPFIVVDLTTIPENLMESELFGHEKGAFTGAHGQKIGRVEISDGATLFFDEIGEIPLHLQVKLLRLLEDQTFTRVGGIKSKKANFRLVAATNRNLFDEVKAGRFREDLYYRLNTLELTIPPLRKRKEDILTLADHFLMHYSKKHKKKLIHLSDEQKVALESYHWPGNVRELKNVIERAVLVAEGDNLELDLSYRSEGCSAESLFSSLPSMNELQQEYIQFVLKHTNGKVSGLGSAAEILKMKRSTLRARMKNLGIY